MHQQNSAGIGPARIILRAAAITLMIAVTFSGCQLLGDLFADRALERITAFEQSLNGDRDDIAEHLHSNADDRYNSPDAWEPFFAPNVTFSFAESAEATGSDGDIDLYEATVTTDPDSNELHQATLEFGLQEDPANDDEVRILTLTIRYADDATEELIEAK
jgi:hypothetical protein